MPFGCLAVRDGRTYSSLNDIIDKYEIGQTLKAKEFCELCLVKERESDKVYACKKFLKKDGRKVRKAAKNEITILKMVNHPNILQLIDAFETRKEYYIIQELATGGDVFDWILDQGNYTEKDASSVVRQVLEAVAYIHSLNIVHRNLKLENLMYYRENNHNKVVLRDFYLSRFENGALTEPCGTPEYLAPEVVARHRYGRPVDCWAIGVIMYILLSGNPPFYDETEEENNDMHNRIIFCRIVAGEYEFDSPYWDDISPAAKDLVCKLMEVDPMLRVTAEEALLHGWIAGNAASEKNLKDGVCAQFEKNFAKAKWRKAIRVTTFMQRLRAPEGGKVTKEAGEGDRGVTSQITSSTSHKVAAENRPEIQEMDKKADYGETLGGEDGKLRTICLEGVPLSTGGGLHSESNPSAKPAEAEGGGRGHRPSSASHHKKPKPLSVHPEAAKKSDGRGTKVIVLEQDSGIKEDKVASGLLDTVSCQKKNVAPAQCVNSVGGHTAAPSAALPTAASRDPKQKKPGKPTSGNWCQTQIPETGLGDAGCRGRGGDGEGTETNITLHSAPVEPRPAHKLSRSAEEQEEETESGASFRGHSYLSFNSGGGIGISALSQEANSSDWMMDSVIEQIERQMAAVFEKIEGDMPSLLEQISDCPEMRVKSSHSSPSSQPHIDHHFSPSAPPTSPRRPPLSFPQLTIQPPAYPPPPPPPPAAFVHAFTQPMENQDERAGQRADHSERRGVANKAL